MSFHLCYNCMSSFHLCHNCMFSKVWAKSLTWKFQRVHVSRQLANEMAALALPTRTAFELRISSRIMARQIEEAIFWTMPVGFLVCADHSGFAGKNLVGQKLCLAALSHDLHFANNLELSTQNSPYGLHICNEALTINNRVPCRTTP